MNKLTHFNQQGDAHMVDVGDKESTHRIAVAEGRIYMQEQTLALIALLFLGFGVAITGYFPSIYGLFLTTFIMSIGFHNRF